MEGLAATTLLSMPLPPLLLGKLVLLAENKSYQVITCFLFLTLHHINYSCTPTA